MIIEELNGTQHSLMTNTTRVIDFVIDSQDPSIEKTDIDGADGYVDQGVRFGGRNMLLILTTFDNPIQARRRIFKLFNGKKRFFISDSTDAGRKWLVRVSGAFTPERLPNGRMRFEIPLISAFPYARSNFSSLEADSASYTSTTSSFTIINNGDIEIDPRVSQTPLIIKFKGASTYLEIENLTNGDKWIYDEVTRKSDNIMIEGVKSTKNGDSIFRDTNQRLITIDEGVNKFRVRNTSGAFKITVDFYEFTI